MSRPRHDGPLAATVAGIVDLVRARRARLPLRDGDRLDGRTVLITGASSGLGRAVAAELLRRGARTMLALRSGMPEVGDALRRETGGQVEMRRLDLGDLASVTELCGQLAASGERVDIVICNAGVYAARSRRTKQGFEQMFGVNYLGHVALVRRLLELGVVPNGTFAGNRAEGQRPRIVFVASDSHRSAEPLDVASVGVPRDYGMRDGMKHYAHSKLLVCSAAGELARRLAAGGDVDVAVHAMCPGAVDTNIAREAPAWLRPVLGRVMRGLFQSPEDAAMPVVYLAAGRAIEGETGTYHLMHQRKAMSPDAEDERLAVQLWDKTSELLDDALRTN